MTGTAARRPTRPKVVVRGVSMSFQIRGELVPALSPIDLELAEGEFVCLVGPSGCGKTTLIRILAGLLQPAAGCFAIAPAEGGVAGRPRTSMVFQEQGLFPWMSVIDNVAFGLKALGVDRKQRLDTARGHLELVGLGKFAGALPHQLSGGMRQRVAIARALASDPELLLMDEPFAALDEQTKLVLEEELVRLWRATRKTVLYVTHSIDEAMALGDRIIVLSARPGRVKAELNVDDYLPRPRTPASLRSNPSYGELFGAIWALLRPEVDISS